MAAIINNRTKRNLAKNIVNCETLISKATGLMFSRKITDKALIFDFEQDERVTLHMMFVFYPIDVLFLDVNRKVVEIKSSLKPFAVYRTKNKIRYAIELPLTAAKGTRIGDKIKF
jgi:uncharacterized protein